PPQGMPTLIHRKRTDPDSFPKANFLFLLSSLLFMYRMPLFCRRTAFIARGVGKVITLKQVEALYWIAELGSFEAAALRLNTTQSAISKRIQELESRFDLEIFDRSRRTACLTPKGEEILQS